MLEIQKAIKKVIEKFIVNMTPLTAAISIGDTTIPIASTRRYCTGDVVVIYNKPSPSIKSSGEVHTITSIPNKDNIIIDTPLVSGYTLANSFVEKMIGFETGVETFLEAVYIGEPAIIPRYPAITINAKSRSSEWLTLESTSETYQIDITVYVLASDYESQYELMQAYVKAIENALFRTFYPLVEPFDLEVLLEDVVDSDTLIKVASPGSLDCIGGWIWLESQDFLRNNKVIRNLGGGVLELAFPVGQNFSAGDSVIRPRRHIYNTLPASTQYGTVNKDSMLKAAVITWTAQEEVRRLNPFIDPLTF